MAVGRLATHIATLLLGKHKPVYNPSLDCGDNVLVTNARQVQFTGKKWRQKHYRWHTGYPGGLKVYPASRMRDEHPERVLWKAVYGMLPKVRWMFCFLFFFYIFFFSRFSLLLHMLMNVLFMLHLCLH